MKTGLAYLLPKGPTVAILSGVSLKIWQALCDWNKPYSPSYRDLMKASGVQSTSSVHFAVRLLEQADLVKRGPQRDGTLRLLVRVE